MRNSRHIPKMAREGFVQGAALCCLMVMAAVAVAGPSGLLAWQENHHRLAQRQLEIQTLTAQRDRLRNQVSLLDPRHADADLTGQLLRSNLNVVRSDEMVLMLPQH